MSWQDEVEKFAAGGTVPTKLIEGLSHADLMATPVSGKWSLQTLVSHLLDSDLIATHRMKRVVAEEKPLLLSYDEDAFAAKLGYEHQNIRTVVELFRINREHTAEFLRRLPEAAFARPGVHNQRGLVTLGEFVKLYTHHVEHHMTFAREKLKALGKPVRV